MTIDVKNLSFAYDETNLLENLSCSFQEGQLISILGPNGSGKSTLLKLLLGLLVPKTGQIFIGGEDLAVIPFHQRAQKLAYVPQVMDLSFDFSVEEVVQMARFARKGREGVFTQEDRLAVEKALAATHLTELAHHGLTTLSGGEAQRVSIARAMAQDTPWILLDEPVNHLDVSHQVSLLNLLESAKKEGKSIILVLHDLNYAALYSDQVLLMDHGKILCHGSPRDVLQKPLLEKVYGIDFEEPQLSGGDRLFFPRLYRT